MMLEKKRKKVLVRLLLFSMLLGVLFPGVSAGEVPDSISYTVESIEFSMRLAPSAPFPLFEQNDREGMVEQDFWIAETPVTYALWYQVRIWAEDNGYTFINEGQEGSQGETGHFPVEENQPVTGINWYDAVIWCNALSDLLGYDPVYRLDDMVVTDATDGSFLFFEERIVQEESLGFRLPTSMEWELAARFQGGDDSHSAIEYPVGDGLYWTPGNYASGARGDYLNEEATGAVAWYAGNSGGRSQEVGSKMPNSLGLYDMSGNGWEWCFDWHPQYFRHSRVIRGGSWNNLAERLQVGLMSSANPGILLHGGFRLVLTHQ